jgi:ABC-type branched-subunit amino acid transport system ATPase component
MSVLENLLRGAYKPDTRKKRNELLEKSFISFPF